jgi:peptidoglycan/xylan/chitin deacetylase (PgdA/CDA1 family)
MEQKKPNALILLDSQDHAALEKIERVECEWMNAAVKVINYRQLHDMTADLRRIATEKEIDFILYSRNDQVFERINIGRTTADLRLGYSSFSGIDTEQAYEQMMTCWADLLRGGARLELREDLSALLLSDRKRDGTFSLMFDLEQLGGARYGLPRILTLLAERKVRATFFVTGLIRQLYPDVLETIAAQGHEIGVHGQYHECLSGLPYAEQRRRVAENCADFRSSYPVAGANFIYRMDDNTIRALTRSGITYFVSFFEHNYHVPSLAYRRLPVRPLPVICSWHWLWLVPIPVETYGRPWITIRNMVNSALAVGRRQGYPHVTVLLHPFRDGAMWHLGTLSRLIDYLAVEKNLRPVLTCNLMEDLPRYRPDAWILYRPEAQPSGPELAANRYLRRNWHNLDMYHLRLGALFEALRRAGKQPVLTLSAKEKGTGTGYAVFPCLPETANGVRYRPEDPLLIRDGLKAAGEDGVWQAFVPPGGYGRDLWAGFRALRPTNWQDLTALPLEVAVRLLHRLKPHRHLF